MIGPQTPHVPTFCSAVDFDLSRPISQLVESPEKTHLICIPAYGFSLSQHPRFYFQVLVIFTRPIWRDMITNTPFLYVNIVKLNILRSNSVSLQIFLL